MFKDKDKENSAQKLAMDLKEYAAVYHRPPYGREIDGTPKLLEKAASTLEGASSCIARMMGRYMDGMPVHY